MKSLISSEICQACGGCCQGYPFVELPESEVETLERATGLNRDAFTVQKSKTAKEYVLDFQKNGDCVFLQKNDGGYSCGVYESRPTLCRKYPSDPLQEIVCASNQKQLPDLIKK